MLFLFSSAFTDNMTKEQRIEIESTLCKVFDGFTDERLKGRYYSMATMSEEEKEDLVNTKCLEHIPLLSETFFFKINKHFLYTDDDSTLEMVGTYDDWPAVIFCATEV